MTPNDDLQSEHARYATLADEMSQPSPDLPRDVPGGEAYPEDYGRPQPQQEQRREPEPQYQQPQRQQQQPEQRQQYNNAPDIHDDPIGHFDARLRNHEAWLQHQHAGDQGRQIWEHIDKSENHYRNELSEGEYDSATDHLKASRMVELYQQFPDTPQNQTLAFRSGFQSAAHMRQAQLQKDVVDVTMHAARNGLTPAEAFYQLALMRGFKPQAVMTKSYARQMMKHIDTVPDREDRGFDEWWDKHYAPLAKQREGQ